MELGSSYHAASGFNLPGWNAIAASEGSKCNCRACATFEDGEREVLQFAGWWCWPQLQSEDCVPFLLGLLQLATENSRLKSQLAEAHSRLQEEDASKEGLNRRVAELERQLREV